MDETPTVVPIKRRRRKKTASLGMLANEAAAVRPKKDRRLTGPNPNREIIKTMRRLGLATVGLGPSAPEIFKAATLQCVQQKLQEIQKMLSWIAPIGPAPAVEPILYPQPAQPAHQLTPDEADALLAKRSPNKEDVCQFDGQPAVYRTRKGVPLCIAHRAQGIEDDQGEVLAERMKMSGGFGGMGNPEVIMVPQNVIDDALARGGDDG